MGQTLTAAKKNSLLKVATHCLLGLSYLFIRLEGYSSGTMSLLTSAKALAMRINDVSLTISVQSIYRNNNNNNNNNNMTSGLDDNNSAAVSALADMAEKNQRIEIEETLKNPIVANVLHYDLMEN